VVGMAAREKELEPTLARWQQRQQQQQLGKSEGGLHP
jgi:hypothetical protein